MHTIDAIFFALLMGFVLLMLFGFTVSLWRELLPTIPRLRLGTVLWKVGWRPHTHHRDPPIFRVLLDGQLRYAASREDVESYLCGLWVQASVTMLTRLPPGQAVEIVLLCGDESVVIQVVREP